MTCCEISWQIVVENLRDFTMDLVREGDTGELDLEDPQLEEKLVNELKAQGVFDQFRKDCLSDVDTKVGVVIHVRRGEVWINFCFLNSMALTSKPPCWSHN